MKRFILLTFAFLGWAWYEMSGGADFHAGSTLASNEISEEVTGTEPRPEVARADTSALSLPRPAAKPAVGISLTSARRVPASGDKVATLDAAVVKTDAAPADASLAKLLDETLPPEEDSPTAADPQDDGPDLRRVTGSRVNLRNGPGTGFSVVTQLVAGDPVHVLSDPGDGWVKLRSVRNERIGWMSDSFLRASLD